MGEGAFALDQGLSHRPHYQMGHEAAQAAPNPSAALNETIIRRSLLALPVLGLVAGVAARYFGWTAPSAAMVWTAVTVPVIVALAVSIVRDYLIGRFGVDAIALVSMTAALIFGEALAANVVAIMYAGGTVLEDFARGRAKRELTALADRSPRTANRIADGAQETVAVADVKVGDVLLVRAGEIIPVDGTLLDLSAALDESAVTGEPLAVRRVAGELLRSGTVNAGETLSMRASALAEESTYAAIVHMVAAAQTSRAPFIRMADRYAVIMLPATLVLAGLAWFLSDEPLRALAVLVVATPCPLILAAPVAFIGGLSRAAQHGVLMKGSEALEALAGIRTAIFDKTGTLTHGGADIIDVETAPGRDKQEMLRLLASLETASRHVLAEAIVASARHRGLMLSLPRDVREYRGAGLEGVVDGTVLRAGTAGLVLRDAALPFWAGKVQARFDDQPVIKVLLAIEDRLAAIFVLGDALRGDARETVAALRGMGVSRVTMLTGDDQQAAARIADTLRLDACISNADPASKVAAVAAEKARAPTMMVGDGINDAPALATASVGIALSARGATASSEASDVLIISNRLWPVADAVRIAIRSRAIARQSILIGLALSGAAMVGAAFGLIAPVAGALLQEAIDVAVILNALRSLRL
jgi:heavy metal translocating P-type ATPase